MADEIIIPRWEWRCFAISLDELASKVQMPSNVILRESDETYIFQLAADASDNVKIRRGRVDVKRLLASSETGLQQWTPAL